MIEIRGNGLQTTVQDEGRHGLQQYGVPVCGSMDRYAQRTANLLVGNPPETEGLEMAFKGSHLIFRTPNVFALAGGNFRPRLDGHPIENNRAYAADAGSILTFDTPIMGSRVFLAFHGGLDLPLVMGSRSTDLRGRFGGIAGRTLLPGDKIAFRHPVPTLPFMEKRVLPNRLILPYSTHPTVRVVLGPEADYFTEDSLWQSLFLGDYKVTEQSDRMGYRLNGPALSYASQKTSDILSNGISFGSIQVPKDQPIIMMADHQTTGGYAKIGTVISVDLPYLAQLRPGDLISFCPTTVSNAQHLARFRQKQLEIWGRWLNCLV